MGAAPRRHRLDPYDPRDSLIHRLPAAFKLSSALAAILGVLVMPRGAWGGYAVVAAAILGVAFAARLRLLSFLKRVLALEPLVLGVAALAWFQPDGARLFGTMLARSTLSLMVMVLLTATTPFTLILAALRRARVPALLLTVLALLYRYLFVLVDEAERLRRARVSRTFVAGRAMAWRGGAAIIARLFVRSTDRAERIYAAMSARGWK